MKKIMCLAMAAVLLLCISAFAEEEKKFDLGGRTVTIGSYNDLTPNENSYTYAEQCALIGEIEAKYNCHIEFVTTNDWHAWDAVIKTCAYSGEKPADIFCHTIDYILPAWATVGLLYPFDDLIDVNEDMWNREVGEYWACNGQHYTVSTAKDGVGTVILFNKRICAEYGISDEYLYELQENREWTWDKCLELAKRCTVDTNNDGKIDIWGFGAYGPAPVIPESFVYSNGAYCTYLDENMHYVYGLNDPAAVEAIEFCRMLVNDSGVVYSDDWTYGMWEKLWNRGKIAFYQVYSWEISNYVANLQNDEFGILLNPIGPQATDYVNAQNIHDGWFISRNAEDPEALAAILHDYLYPYDWKEDLEPWEYFENTVFDDESLDTIRLIEGRSVYALGEAATWFRNNILWSDFGVLSNVPARTFVETNEAPSQAAFDELRFFNSGEAVSE